jgi:hypothetical protein
MPIEIKDVIGVKELTHKIKFVIARIKKTIFVFHLFLYTKVISALIYACTAKFPTLWFQYLSDIKTWFLRLTTHTHLTAR